MLRLYRRLPEKLLISCSESICQSEPIENVFGCLAVCDKPELASKITSIQVGIISPWLIIVGCCKLNPSKSNAAMSTPIAADQIHARKAARKKWSDRLLGKLKPHRLR